LNARATLAIARKDAVEIVLNRSALVTVLSPIFIALLFAALNVLLSGKTTPVLIYNPSGSAIEHVVLDSPLPNVALTRAASAEQVAATFASSSSSYALGLAVPPDYDAALRQGIHPPLALYVNGADVDSATGQLMAGALAGYAASSTTSVRVVTLNPRPPEASASLGSYLAMFGLVSSFIVGAAVVAGLLLEEKEKDTLRLLMTSRASFADVVAGKLLVGLGYQMTLVLLVLAIQGGYTGAMWLVLFFGLLGSLLSLALGLLFGSLAKNTGVFGAFIALVSAFYTVPALFVGPLGQALRDSSLVRATQIFPTFYLAHGILAALGGAGPRAVLSDIAVIATCTLLVLGVALWSLRRESAAMGAI